MKGGGLTWAGWLMVGVGGMLVYSGMTGASLISALSDVLSGRTPKVAPATTGSSGGSGLGGAGTAGGGAGGGAASSWNENTPADTNPPAGGGTADGASGFPPGYVPKGSTPRVPIDTGVLYPLVGAP